MLLSLIYDFGLHIDIFSNSSIYIMMAQWMQQQEKCTWSTKYTCYVIND